MYHEHVRTDRKYSTHFPWRWESPYLFAYTRAPHVITMLIRPTGDDYIEYRYDKVRGYEVALAAAMKDNFSAEEAHDKLCNDFDTAIKYGFAGSEFTKGFVHGPNEALMNGPNFDIESISKQDRV